MKTYSVMIVEDDPGFQEILTSFIKRQEKLDICAVVDNSVDAALKITRLKPDILLLDIEISGLNGIETLDTIEKPPVTLVISANADMKNVVMKHQAVIDFIAKPIENASVLYDGLQKCISRCVEKI